MQVTVESGVHVMSWEVMGWPGRFGRARGRRERGFDACYGAGQWRLAHTLTGRVLECAQAARLVELSYLQLLRANPSLLDDLCNRAQDVLENARSNIRSGLDYAVQERCCEHVFDIALRRVVREMNREFRGEELVRIGGPACGHLPLSPGRVAFIQPERIVEPRVAGWWDPDSVLCFWESNRILLAQADPGLTRPVG
jgi:hypothetical protein